MTTSIHFGGTQAYLVGGADQANKLVNVLTSGNGLRMPEVAIGFIKRNGSQTDVATPDSFVCVESSCAKSLAAVRQLAEQSGIPVAAEHTNWTLSKLGRSLWLQKVFPQN